MKLALCSDLHLDFKDLPDTFYQRDEGVNVLVLAGDTIESRSLNTVKHVFTRLSDLYSRIIMISGNHEFYRTNFNKSKQQVREFIEDFHNVTYLDNESLDLESDCVLVGTTLWTSYNNNNPLTQLYAMDYMNDHKLIRLEEERYRTLKPHDCYRLHIESLEFIRGVVERHRDKRVVVITHHAPSFQSVDDVFRHEIHANGCYASNLDEFILEHENIILWQHGHMHHHKDYMIGTCRVVCHPRGYPSDNGRGKDYYYNYKPFVVEV